MARGEKVSATRKVSIQKSLSQAYRSLVETENSFVESIAE
jgi:hypothetical protein